MEWLAASFLQIKKDCDFICEYSKQHPLIYRDFLSIWKYSGHIWKRIINIVKSGLIQAWKF